MKKLLFLLIIFLPFCTDKTDKTDKTKQSANIIHVSDGDTVVLLDADNKQTKIRLWGIDCPEKGQDYGTKATDRTKELCDGKTIRVEIMGTDQYKRTLAIVYAGEINVNEELIRSGLAWRYKYTKSDYYDELEAEARQLKLNIWSMKKPIAPWDFRKSKKK